MADSIEILSRGKLPHMKLTGILTRQACETFASVVEEPIQQYVKVRFLFEIPDLHGWIAAAV